MLQKDFINGLFRGMNRGSVYSIQKAKSSLEVVASKLPSRYSQIQGRYIGKESDDRSVLRCPWNTFDGLSWGTINEFSSVCWYDGVLKKDCIGKEKTWKVAQRFCTSKAMIQPILCECQRSHCRQPYPISLIVMTKHFLTSFSLNIKAFERKGFSSIDGSKICHDVVHFEELRILLGGGTR